MRGLTCHLCPSHTLPPWSFCWEKKKKKDLVSLTELRVHWLFHLIHNQFFFCSSRHHNDVSVSTNLRSDRLCSWTFAIKKKVVSWTQLNWFYILIVKVLQGYLLYLWNYTLYRDVVSNTSFYVVVMEPLGEADPFCSLSLFQHTVCICLR